jgi:solute carrier family 25 phosphate transporter 3
MAPQFPGQVLLAPSPAAEKEYDAMYYLKGAAAGGICCSITHGALTPVDVVKTRVQLDPIKVRRRFDEESNICLAKFQRSCLE